MNSIRQIAITTWFCHGKIDKPNYCSANALARGSL